MFKLLVDIEHKVQSPTYKLKPELQSLKLSLKEHIKKLNVHKSNAENKVVQGVIQKYDNVNNTPLNINHTGNIICRTHGGIQFRTVVDICLDHSYSLAKKFTLNDIKLSAQSGETTLPIYASHIITSNFIEVLKNDTISEFSVHADTDSPELLHNKLQDHAKLVIKKPVNVIDIREPDFGARTKLNVYKPVALGKHSEEMQDKIDSYNSFVIRLKALRQYRSQRLSDAKEVNDEIHKHILIYASDQIKLITSAKTHNNKKSLHKLSKLTCSSDIFSQDILKILNSIRTSPEESERMQYLIDVVTSLLVREAHDHAEFSHQLATNLILPCTRKILYLHLDRLK